MSSKAEKTSNHSDQQPRLNIFFRSPLLLKIVAWLGSLSFLSSTGLVWADLKPVSTAKTDVPELIQAAPSPVAGNVSAKLEDQETYGPYLPLAQKPSSVQTNSTQLPNREVPVAVAPADAVILPTGTIVRPQHTDILGADNYTVGVNELSSEPTAFEEFISIAVPAPLSRTLPTQNREAVSASASQVQPPNPKSLSIVSQSTPTTSIQSQPQLDRSADGYQAVPTVANIPNPSLPRFGRTGSGSSLPTVTPAKPATSQVAQRRPLTPQVMPLLGLRNTVVAPMKPAATAQRVPTKPAAILATTPVPAVDSVEISVPTPRNGQMAVQPVASLPQISANRAVPNVPAIPSVRPAGMAFVNTGEATAQLIYPLSSPAPMTSGFGWRTHPITGSRRFHSGLDIGAPMGAPVVAAGTGIVMSSGWLGGYGKAIVIQHNGVQQTLYGHLSEIFVQPGQRIEQGTVIGRVGSTGNSTGPHLHFETKVATSDGWVAIDPGEEMKYALDNLRRVAPFAQRDLPLGYQ